jgi:4-hydroxy-tetrahydrodipicolinate synthase
MAADLAQAGVPLADSKAANWNTSRVAQTDSVAAYVAPTTHTSVGIIPR